MKTAKRHDCQENDLSYFSFYNSSLSNLFTSCNFKNCEKLHVDIALTSFCRFRAIIFHNDTDVLFSEDLDQGDQIGRILAQWATDYLVHYFHYRGSQKIWATFSLSIYAL
jgi:hypothetical protein